MASLWSLQILFRTTAANPNKQRMCKSETPLCGTGLGNHILYIGFDENGRQKYFVEHHDYDS